MTAVARPTEREFAATVARMLAARTSEWSSNDPAMSGSDFDAVQWRGLVALGCLGLVVDPALGGIAGDGVGAPACGPLAECMGSALSGGAFVAASALNTSGHYGLAETVGAHLDGSRLVFWHHSARPCGDFVLDDGNRERAMSDHPVTDLAACRSWPSKSLEPRGTNRRHPDQSRGARLAGQRVVQAKMFDGGFPGLSCPVDYGGQGLGIGRSSSVEDLRAFLASGLAGYKVPSRVQRPVNPYRALRPARWSSASYAITRTSIHTME